MKYGGGMNELPYPSDLTAAQWALIEPLLPAPKPKGRKRRVDLRKITTAILYAQFMLDIVCKPRGQIGFSVLPWRWIVERTFAWLGNYRRLARDYEINPRTTEAWVKIAMIHLMVRRLA